MCVQPNLIWPLQLFSNMIMQNMIILFQKSVMDLINDYSCYYTIQKITWWWERAGKCEEVQVKAKSTDISPKARYHPSQNCLIYGASSILAEK